MQGTQAAQAAQASPAWAIPPIYWARQTNQDDFKRQLEQFDRYYEKRGFWWAPVNEADRRKGQITPACLPRAYTHDMEHDGWTYLLSEPMRRGVFGFNTFDNDTMVYTCRASQLREIHDKRKEELAVAMRELEEAQTEPESADKTRKVQSLDKEIRRLGMPLQQFVPPLRLDNKQTGFVDHRKTQQPKDIMANNAPRDTMHKFKPIIERMQAVGAFGDEMIIKDGEKIKMHRTWNEGDVWRPKPEDLAEDVPTDECTPTFHGLAPRHPRPDQVGPGHLGYDMIFEKSRDSIYYTADDLPERQYNESRTRPITFVSEDGKKTVVDEELSPLCKTMQKDMVLRKPLRQILTENEASNAKRAAYQGRGARKRQFKGPEKEQGAWN